MIIALLPEYQYLAVLVVGSHRAQLYCAVGKRKEIDVKSHQPLLVPEVGVEPTRPHGHTILNRAWLPLHHSGLIAIISYYFIYQQNKRTLRYYCTNLSNILSINLVGNSKAAIRITDAGNFPTFPTTYRGFGLGDDKA